MKMVLEKLKAKKQLKAAIGTRRGADHSTALHIVVWAGRIDIINLLMEAGASLEIPNKYGRTLRELIEQRTY